MARSKHFGDTRHMHPTQKPCFAMMLHVQKNRRADMSWRTFARRSHYNDRNFPEIQIWFSFLVPDVDLQSDERGFVVGKCHGILNHPH